MTALTVYPTSTAATTVTTGNTLATTPPASETSNTTKVAKSTGWGNLFPQGNNGAWAANASALALGANNAVFILDDTSLEGQQFLAGNYTPTIKVSCSSAITMSILCHVGVRNSAGVYTAIGSSQTTPMVFVGGVAQTLTLPAISGAATQLNTGDKFVIDFDADVTVATTSNTATISLFMNGGTAEQVVTPGFQAGAASVSLTGAAPNVTAAGAVGTVSTQQFVSLTGAAPNVTVAGVAGAVTAAENASLAAVPATVTVNGDTGTVTVSQNASLTAVAANVTVAGSGGVVEVPATVNLTGPVPTITVTGPAGATTTVTFQLFTPPTRYYTPSVTPTTPEIRMVPAAYFNHKNIPKPVNVFKLDDGTYVENMIGLDFWSHVITAYYGGHDYPIDPTEAAALAAAGYGGDIT